MVEKERTLVLIKPDGVVRNLIGRILMRFEDAGLKIAGMKMIWADDKFAGRHYREDIAVKHGEKIRNDLINYLKDGPVVALVLEGVDAIGVVRKMIGGTYPNEAVPGTIRGDFAHVSKIFANEKNLVVKNLIHASSDIKDAEIEIHLWFSDSELYSYKTVHEMICFE